MAVLVTGGAGYIGSQMVHDLVDAGERVVVLQIFDRAVAVPPGCRSSSARPAIRCWCRGSSAEQGVDAIITSPRSIVVPLIRVRDPLAITATTPPIPGTLIEMRDRRPRAPFNLFLDGCGLWQPAAIPVAEDAPNTAIRLMGGRS